MARQGVNHLGVSDVDSSPREIDSNFLQFTRQLNQYYRVQDLLLALPSTLRNLVSADTFMVLHEWGSNFGSVVDTQSHKSLQMPDFSSLGGSAWICEQEGPIVIPSIAQETRFDDLLDWFRSNGDRSLCVIPLRTPLHCLGAICAGRVFENSFSDDEVSLLALAADHAALAVDDRLNFAASEEARMQLERERTKLKLTLDLNNSIVSNLDLKKLIESVSPNIRKLMQLDAVALILPGGDNGGLEVYALDFPDGKGHIRIGEALSEGSLAQSVFDTGKPWIGDISQESPHYFCSEAALREGLNALCLLPLTRCQQTLGVLAAARLRRDSFTNEDVEFLLQIAAQIAIGIDNALAYRRISELSTRLAQEKVYLEDEIRSELNFEEIVGNSAALRKVLRQVEAVAPTDSTVLICGETGCGKELVARAVHKLSARQSYPFVRLNCAAIPTGLLESELFGHEKGAFTGAIGQRVGRFELASGGTIFLDEIAEIPLELQPKLLRVLQEREFERLGSSRTLHTNARLIAATNRDLHAQVDNQKFRSDLFYRLNVFPIQVPSLRERPEDIPSLVRHFAQHYSRLMKRRIDTISSDTMNALVRYTWPGNIRELQNVIERAVILSSGKELKVQVSDLKPRLAENGGSTTMLTLEEVEKRHILTVLEQTNWLLSGPHGAAARLGMKRPTLQFRMRKLGISRPDRHSA